MSDARKEFVTRVSEQVSLAIRNAHLYMTEKELSDVLQAFVLTMPESVPGIDFGTYYKSATVEAKVGGDFYDLFRLADGRVGLLIGDVSGHGLQAASLTVTVKAMLRAYCCEHGSPATALHLANSTLGGYFGDGGFATVFLAALDVESGEMIHCAAGSEGETNFGTAGLAAPKAASSSVAR